MSSFGDFAAGVYLPEAQNPIPPPLHCIRVYSIIIHTGKGGGGESWTRVEQFTKLGRKYLTWLNVSTAPPFPSFTPLYLILSPLLDSPDNSIHDRLGSAGWRRSVDTEQCKKFVTLCFCKKIREFHFYVSIFTWEGLAWLRMRTTWQRRPSESSLLQTRNIPCKDMHACMQ